MSTFSSKPSGTKPQATRREAEGAADPTEEASAVPTQPGGSPAPRPAVTSEGLPAPRPAVTSEVLPPRRSAVTAEVLPPPPAPHTQPLRPKVESATPTQRRPRPPVPPGKVPAESSGSLLGELDAAFGAIIEPSRAVAAAPGALTPTSSSMPEVRELFSALAKNHMRQVRDFMIAVRWNEAPREWAAICEPVVLSLVRAARQMDMPELCEALTSYATALQRAAGQPEGMLGPETREALLLVYGRLSEQMPEVFALEGERDRREAIIVHALLEQVPDVRRLTIDRMYAAGLTSLETLFLAKPDDIAATTGIGETLAARIVESIAAYKAEAAQLVDPSRRAECDRLSELARELRALNERFAALADAWADEASAEKKRLRRARTCVLLKTKVLLARLGEVDRIALLERLPFARKIENIEAFVRDMQGQQAKLASAKVAT
jgi:hypothetical protein